MGKVCLFVICMYCSIHHLSAQQEEQQTQPVQQPLVTQDDILGNMNVDYAKIKLPPLSVLYENARSTPSLQILEKEKQKVYEALFMDDIHGGWHLYANWL